MGVVKRSTVLTEAGEDSRPNRRHYTTDPLIAYRLKIPPAINHALHYYSLNKNVHEMTTENQVKHVRIAVSGPSF